MTSVVDTNNWRSDSRRKHVKSNDIFLCPQYTSFPTTGVTPKQSHSSSTSYKFKSQ